MTLVSRPRADRSTAPRRPRWRGILGAAAVVAITALLGSGLIATRAEATPVTDPCGTGSNPIVCENSKPGAAPSEWDIDGAGDPAIQGFATDISVNVGSKVDFKIDTTASAYTIDIYRTGWYQGLGARKIASVKPSAALPQRQPQCITDAATELYDCGTWRVSAGWTVPSTAVSGVYVALLTRADTGGRSHITFIVRNEASTSKILFQTSDPTWHAYNTYGGSDFYQGAANGRAYKISYNRPFATRGDNNGRDFYFSSEYATVRFLEKNGYDVSYFSGVDTDRRGSLLQNHDVFLSVGHDEYWSGPQRANIEAARDAGVHLQFLAGNEGYWRTRYEPSADASATDHRTLVSYKETWSYSKIDPSPEWTGTMRDPRYASTAAGAASPENALIGTQYMVNYSDLAVTVSADEGKYRLWRNTPLASLTPGSTAALAPHTIGYESNEDVDNGFRPAGLIRLSTTVGDVPEYLQDFGNLVAAGTTRHHLTLYRAASGALVFSAASVQWGWGLDATHDGDGAPADPRMQQAQVNLLADMGVQPLTLDGSLVQATASTDSTAPVVTITAPVTGATVPNGSAVVVTGTASDVGGLVAGVEVSLDGGSSWHAATGTTSWSYTGVQHGSGTQSILARAADDSANLSTSAAVAEVSVAGPYSVLGDRQPKVADAGDASSVELGLRFTPQVDGFVSGVRFFKSAANTGTHTGSLWTATGSRLATVTFPSETASGWQTATFATPQRVTAGVSYVVSYTAPNGHYTSEPYAWAYRGETAGPLTVEGGFGAPSAGLYNTSLGFPADSYQNTNYFVDAVFTDIDESPLTVSEQWPLPGSTSVPAGSTVTGAFSKDVDPATVSVVVTDANGAVVATTTAYDAVTRKFTTTPTAPLAGFVAHTVAVSATSSGGDQVGAGGTWTFTTVKPPAADGACPCGLFDDGTTPQVLEVADSAVTLGVRFASDVDGTVRGVRFYKGAGNGGTHVGTLWSATGQQLARATFATESTSGWQTVLFDTPVDITKDTEYTASYRTTVGNYSATPAGFGAGSGFTRGPLRAAGDSGAYSYADAFPGSKSTTNYLVDVVFDRRTDPITVVQTTPADAATDVATGSSITISLSTAIASGATFAVASGGSAITGVTTLSADGKTLTFAPSQPLPAGATVSVTVSGVTSTQGAALAQQQWSFATVASTPNTTEYSLFGDQTPTTAAVSDDASPVELGVSFVSSVGGQVTALRFYKGPGNGGTHVGSLWDAAGNRIATATFANESASGWQQVQLAQPVALTPGASYVVSYLAPQGHYAHTANYFASPRTVGPLTAGTAQNGRYLYGAAGGFPTFTYGAANYSVDVVFAASASLPPIVASDQAPVAGSADALADTSVAVTISGAGTVNNLTLEGPSGAIAGTSSYDWATQRLVFHPTTPLDWSTSYTATATIDGAVPTNGTWSFTTGAQPAAPDPGASLFPSSAVPANPSWADPDPVQLGVRFVPAVDGSITGVGFYRGATDASAHTMMLWAGGQLVGSATAEASTTAGWQTAWFAAPVPVTAGTEYRASYTTSAGAYAVDLNTLAGATTVDDLSIPAGGGVYQYGTGYPDTVVGHNYWVDVHFVRTRS